MTDTLKIEEAHTVKDYEMAIKNLYVAVYQYPGSDAPWGISHYNKSDLLKMVSTWSGIDKTIPVRIYTLGI
jgi:hypothetical protein